MISQTFFPRPRPGRDDFRATLRHLNSLPRPELLPAAEQAILFRRAQADPPDIEARNQLVLMHRGFAIARARAHAARVTGLEPNDLIQLALIGLMAAIARFDPDRGRAFTTYADYWIKNEIKEELTCRSRNVRIPNYLWTTGPRYLRAQKILRLELGRPATLAEVAARLGIRPARAARLRRAIRHLNKPEKIMSNLPGLADGTPYANALPDHRAGAGAAALAREAQAERLRAAVARLPAIEARIVRRYYDLDGQGPTTYRAIGQEFGFSNEWARLRLNRALRILRQILENERSEEEVT